MRRAVVALVALTSLLACIGERTTQQLEVGVGEGDAVADTTFPAFATRQLGRLRPGTTLEQWLAASPRDTLVFAREAGALADSLAGTGFCARASLRHPLAGGGTAVRHAYFYPPEPNPALPLPTPVNRARLLRASCTLGVVTARFDAPTDSAAEAAARTLGDSLAQGTTSVRQVGARAVVAAGWLPAYAPDRPATAPAASLVARASTPDPDAPELRALSPGLACTGDAAHYHRAVQDAEALARSTQDRALAARLHLALADTYADLVALSYASAGDTSGFAIPEPSGLRARAAEHYRAALELDPSLPQARRAWGTAWRLLAGLIPERRAGC